MLLDDYIEQCCSEEPEYLRRIWRETNVRELNGRMVCGRMEGRLLAMVSSLLRPRRILELGTFTGYSALCLAEGLTEDGRLDTIEIDDELEDTILRNLHLSPLGDKIHLHIGPAEEVIPQLDQQYDLVFLDADKRRYVEDLELVLPKVREGGVILADNTLWSGKVVNYDERDLKRDKQLEGILRFNELVAHDKRLETVMLPVRDGLTMIRFSE